MANRRLNQMSGGRYELVLKEGARRANAQSGLDIDVMDYSTDQRRSSESLSGGESFFTSLALALGLSDVVQNRAGGRQLDALFIDEGFGTLSDGYLDKALEVLNQMTEGDRLVGIISHVDKLNESIPQKILVTNTGSGSKIEMIQ
jgi:DNA repair exonuclease SbcCD ATPase subunit